MLPNSPSNGSSPAKPAWPQAITSSIVLPSARLGHRRLVEQRRVVVDEVPDTGAVEVVGDGDHHVRTDVDRPLGLRLRGARQWARRTVNVSITGSGSCGLSSTKYSPGSQIEGHLQGLAGGDRAVAALDRHHRRERRIAGRHRLVEGDAVVEPGDDEVVTDVVGASRFVGLRLQGDVDESAGDLWTARRAPGHSPRS